MKPFTKRLALVMGLLFTALLCLGVVFIDSTSVFWKTEVGVVKLYVSNTIAVITVQTNGRAIGIFSTNSTFALDISPRRPSTNSSATGESSANIGGVNIAGATGGNTVRLTTGTGGAGGGINLNAGIGGEAPLALTNNTGGAGGVVSLFGGDGGGTSASVATNDILGGNGGAAGFGSGSGGSPSSPATNTIGGNGGNLSLTGGLGGTPTAGWSRKGGSGASISLNAGNGGDAVRTNAGFPGGISLIAGNSGAATTAPGNPVPGGTVNLTAGNGSTGPTTNSDGGHVFIAGGAPGSGAVPGNVVVGRTSAGASRGGLQIGPSVTGTTATLTNLLSVTATLDFGSIGAGNVADLPVAFSGAADGDVVTVAVPLASVTNCTWTAFASNAVVYVRAANTQLVSAQDPNSGSFRIALQKYR